LRGSVWTDSETSVSPFRFAPYEPYERYYKRIEVPEMKMLDASLSEGALSWHHANNTLVVSHQKPREVLELELKDKTERKTMETRKDDGDVQCNQQ